MVCRFKLSTATRTILTNEEVRFSSLDEEIKVVSPPDSDGDNILSVNLMCDAANGVPLPEGDGK